ncbi:MAG: hypothetical protein ACI9MR_004438 [Myxococcota bacterium]|jgi:hypothetical protein
MSDKIGDYEVHPACAMLPLMSEAAVAEMAADIQANGQQQPIWVYQGQILDGRNRLRACEIGGMVPEIQEWTGEDPVRWVLSLNFHRRHLTDSQKAVVGARAEALLTSRAEHLAESPVVTPTAPVADSGADADAGAEAKVVAPPSKRMLAMEARRTAAVLVNVSPQAIARGRKLLDRAVPELVSAVERGVVSVTQASRVAELSPARQTEVVALGDEAVVGEARRIQQSKAARKPSFLRALNDLDAECATWSLDRTAEGSYRFQSQGAVGDDIGFELTLESLKEVVLGAHRELVGEDE